MRIIYIGSQKKKIISMRIRLAYLITPIQAAAGGSQDTISILLQK